MLRGITVSMCLSLLTSLLGPRQVQEQAAPRRFGCEWLLNALVRGQLPGGQAG